MAAIVDLQIKCNASDTQSLAVGGGTDDIRAKIEKTFRLTSSSTPDVTQVYAATISLAAGTATIDLTSISTLDGTTTISGDVVQGYMIENKGSNSMTFIKAATNGYDMFTATNGTVLQAGDVIVQQSSVGFGTVGASAKDITVNGTGTESFDLILWSGAA